ncbi:MscS family membrane protein [Desulfitispora alkaliphila]|uniref:mechanosensitive ion channel family protein n=1 Tax=Desulfitispora alkaliphila TaxID=622674 RepID=UPI003D1901F2
MELDPILNYLRTHPLTNDLAVAFIIFIIFLVFRKLFTSYVFKTILGLTRRTKLEVDTKLLLAFERPLHVFFALVGFFASLMYLPLTEAQDLIVLRLFRSMVIVLIAWGLYNFVDTESTIFRDIEKKLDLQVDKILVPFLSKGLRFIILFLAFAMIADEFGYDVNGFIAGLGLGGLALALAAQDTARNIFGGVVIILDKPFTIGDWIKADSVEGTVEDITFRSTKIRTFAQAIVTVPNSTLTNQPVTNWTRMGKRQITFKLGVTYSTPSEKLQRCVNRIRDMLMKHSEIHPETIFVNFDSFNESSLDIFLYFFTNTTNWGNFLQVKEDVNLKIMAILEEEGVSIAFPSRSIYLEKEQS